VSNRQFTPEERRLLIDNSLERVLNNAIYVGTKAMRAKDIGLSERAGILTDDCRAMKDLASRLWNEARNSLLEKQDE